MHGNISNFEFAATRYYQLRHLMEKVLLCTYSFIYLCATEKAQFFAVAIVGCVESVLARGCQKTYNLLQKCVFFLFNFSSSRADEE